MFYKTGLNYFLNIRLSAEGSPVDELDVQLEMVTKKQTNAEGQTSTVEVGWSLLCLFVILLPIPILPFLLNPVFKTALTGHITRYVC